MPRFQKGQSQGSVQVAKYGYRVRLYLHGRDMYGPWRDTHAKAEADLVRARACDDIDCLLRQLVLDTGGEGGGGEDARKRRGPGRRGARRRAATEEAQAPEAIQAEARTTVEPARAGLPLGAESPSVVGVRRRIREKASKMDVSARPPPSA